MKIYDIVAERKEVNEGPLKRMAAALGSNTAATGVAMDKDVNRMLKQFKVFWKNTNQAKPTVALVASYLGRAGFPVKSPQDVNKYLKAALANTTGGKLKKVAGKVGRAVKGMMPKGGTAMQPGESIKEALKRGQKVKGPDGDTYTWGGAQFISDTTGKVAKRDVAQQLKQQQVPPNPNQQQVPPNPNQQQVPPNPNQQQVPPNPKQQQVPPNPKRVLSGSELNTLFTYLVKKGFGKSGGQVDRSKYGFTPGGAKAGGAGGAPDVQKAINVVKAAGYTVSK